LKSENYSRVCSAAKERISIVNNLCISASDALSDESKEGRGISILSLKFELCEVVLRERLTSRCRKRIFGGSK